MTRGVPMIDPKVDLAGATPETLARAMLRQPHLRARTRVQPAVGDQVAVEGATVDQSRSQPETSE